MIGFQPDFSSSPLEEGWAGDFSRMGVINKPKKLKEAKKVLIIDEETFDDTFQLHRALLAQDTSQRALNRLREAAYPDPEGASSHDKRNPKASFSRGVPTNDATSSKNYKLNHVKVIDGEHKTLLCLGKINEAMDDDDDIMHLHEHRMLLSNPDLTETQRAGLIDHINTHSKARKKKIKAAQETAEAASHGKFKKGFGFLSKAKRAPTDDVIPQDDPQSAERKRTAGMISMEARSHRRGRFSDALRSRRGL